MILIELEAQTLGNQTLGKSFYPVFLEDTCDLVNVIRKHPKSVVYKLDDLKQVEKIETSHIETLREKSDE